MGLTTRASTLLATALLLSSAPVAAQSVESRIQACSTVIGSSLARLDCYDRLAATIAPVRGADGPATASALVTVALADIGLQGSRYQKYITIELVVSNQLPKALRALTGVITFRDLFDRDILAVNLTITEDIPPQQFVEWEGSIEYNEFMDTHNRLVGTDLADLKTAFVLDEVIYADGTRERFANRP